jgi:EmrB/QacA subfamily drug resistance transporter
LQFPQILCALARVRGDHSLMTLMTRRPSVRRRWTVLAVCCLSMFLVGLDTTIVNIGLPAIGAGLHVGTIALEWTVDAYTLVLASLLITSGALADRFGRRRVFQLGLVVFGAGSLLCAIAPSVGLLITARAVQGIGGSMLSPVALAIVVNVFPDAKERAQAIGAWAAVFGLSMAAGPVVGGALIAGLGWRSVFWINAPIIVAALLLSFAFVPESRSPQVRRLDITGQLLLTVLVGISVGLLIEGPRIGWTSPIALAGYLCVAAAACAFARVSRRPAPLMDLRLFRRPVFTAAVLGAVAVFVALNATLLINTLYLQHTRGMTPIAAGLATLPMALGATVCAPLSGYLVGRLGPRIPLSLAGAFITAGGLSLIALETNTDLWRLLLAYLLIGTGFGFGNAPITTTAVSGLPRDRAAFAGAITSTARQFGAAVGIAVAGSIIAGASPEVLPAATHPVWFLVAACGLFLVVMAQALTPTGTRSSPANPRL